MPTMVVAVNIKCSAAIGRPLFFIPYINFMPCSKFKRIFLSRGQTVSILFISSSKTDVTKTIAGIGTLDKHNQRGNSKKKNERIVSERGTCGLFICAFGQSLKMTRDQ